MKKFKEPFRISVGIKLSQDVYLWRILNLSFVENFKTFDKSSDWTGPLWMNIPGKLCLLYSSPLCQNKPIQSIEITVAINDSGPMMFFQAKSECCEHQESHVATDE